MVQRGGAQQGGNAPLPDIRALMLEVQEHQKQVEKVRENYTYSAQQTTQDIDSNGQVKKTETQEAEDFFVNGHLIERTVKKDGKTLDDHEQQKETERVTKLVEKAEKTPPDQSLEGQGISISRVLEIMDVRNPRREVFRGRSAILFDFIGRKDAKTHGLAEDASKKLQGTMWIDEADRQVAQLEVSFTDNFRVAGGLVASVEKGSSFRFDQNLVNGEIWLPTGAEANLQARVLQRPISVKCTVPRFCCHPERAERVEGPAFCNFPRKGGKPQSQFSAFGLPYSVLTIVNISESRRRFAIPSAFRSTRTHPNHDPAASTRNTGPASHMLSHNQHSPNTSAPTAITPSCVSRLSSALACDPRCRVSLPGLIRNGIVSERMFPIARFAGNAKSSHPIVPATTAPCGAPIRKLTRIPASNASSPNNTE
jgi:hypothetical protein